MQSTFEPESKKTGRRCRRFGIVGLISISFEQMSMTDLPPLEALRFFEAAARHGSFAAAAKELGVSAAAISYRVKALERHLGAELFQRYAHGVSLNVQGRAYLRDIERIFAELHRVTERRRGRQETELLKLVAIEVVAEKWLMPLLGDFRTAHPDIAIEFEVDHGPVDPKRRDFDVWVAFTDEVPHSLHSEKLFEGDPVSRLQPGAPGRPGPATGAPRSEELAAGVRPALDDRLDALVQSSRRLSGGPVAGFGLSSLYDGRPGRGRRARGRPGPLRDDCERARPGRAGRPVRFAGGGARPVPPGHRPALARKARREGLSELAPRTRPKELTRDVTVGGCAQVRSVSLRFPSLRPALLFVGAVWAGLVADAVAQGSAASDRAALETVYRATGGDNWTNNTNWLSDAPLETWYGVEVTDGRVTGLRLGGWDETVRRHVGNGLTGVLPPELGTLSHLRWLQITGNRGLTGAIPAALGRLGNLEWLELDHNALAGSIPTELGNLSRLGSLRLSSNPLTGRIPVELGNLTGLTHFNLGWTMLSGPIPARLTRLSALEWLQLDGTGLCAPDTAAVRAWLATIRDFTGAICEEPLIFLRVLTRPGVGVFTEVVAVADLNGDGRDDVLVADYLEYNVGTPEKRLTKAPLRVLVNVGDGSFRHAPELVEGTIDVRTPIVVADDLNGDGRDDLAVFDAGVYVADGVGGYGNPPQLFLSSPDGRLRPSAALADAVRREHESRPQPRYSGPADLHVKTAASGDIDGDGDIDLWVESSGGANVIGHFTVNNGDGTFTIDPDRAPYELLHNPPPEFWRHVGNALVDVDSDGDLDLALGQIRDFDPTHVNQFSIVLVNDGTGHYSTRIELPHPAFYDGYTSVPSLTHFDVNADGFQDLLLMHERNGDTLPDVIEHTGRYVQVLVNRGGTSFVDETPARMGDQSATTPERDSNGDPLHNVSTRPPRMHDVDRDGCADLAMWRVNAFVSAESPLVYLNDGSGRFRAVSPVRSPGWTAISGTTLCRRS